MTALQTAFKSPFTIYNASAGSGKTYTLSLLYISRLLSSNEALAQRRLLAITFTKKAAQEMKLRIVEQLMQIAAEPNAQEPKTDAFIEQIAEATGLTKDEIIGRAKQCLQQLFSHYGLFQVTTIDAFNFRLLQQFAFDLNLPHDFEAYLDSKTLIHEATEAIFSKIGKDETLTNLLIEFAERAFKEKGAVNIYNEVSDFSMLLTKEKNFRAIHELLKFNQKQWKEDRWHLMQGITAAENSFKTTLNEVLKLLDKAELLEDLKTNNYFKFLQQLNQSNQPADSFFDKYASAKTPQYLTTEDGFKLYTQKAPDAVKLHLDELRPKLLALRQQLIEQSIQTAYFKEILKSLLPTSLISDLAEAVQNIKQEQQILPIHEFNFIINQHIKNLPAPFIYERIGNRIQHYFIDEFQDTSVMQWENMVPLVENSFQSINGKTGSLSLMGDVKQSIYRFRGGNPEQFSALIHDKSPFQINPLLQALNTNYRSASNIVTFNNRFFETIIPLLEDNPLHKKVYEHSLRQEIHHKDKSGYVELRFFEKKNSDPDDDEPDKNVLLKIEAIIADALNRGFSPGDIAVIFRANAKVQEAVEYLSNKEIKVSSDNAQLLAFSHKVKALIAFLQAIRFSDEEAFKNLFLYHYAMDKHLEDVYSFIQKYSALTIEKILEKLTETTGIVNDIQILPLYEALNLICAGLKLDNDAYLSAWMTWVHRLCSTEKALNFTQLLEHWEVQKEELRISETDEVEAVQLMTIHKVKGLQYPVVIVADASLDLTPGTKTDEVWVDVSQSPLRHLSIAYMKTSKKFSYFTQQTKQLRKEFEENYCFDEINTAYVAFTRPEEELYVLCPFDKKETNLCYHLMNYAGYVNLDGHEEKIWNQGQKQTKHARSKTVIDNDKKLQLQQKHHLLSLSLVTDFESEEIAFGNEFHQFMAEIFSEQDIRSIKQASTISPKQKTIFNMAEKIIYHPKLSIYFQEDFQRFNEKEIFSPQFGIQRIDKLCLKGNEAVIIDYKTGVISAKDRTQMQEYKASLAALNFQPKAMLVYISESELNIEEV